MKFSQERTHPYAGSVPPRQFKWAYSVWAARQTTCPVTKQGVDIGDDGAAVDIVEEVECISPALLLSRYDVKVRMFAVS